MNTNEAIHNRNAETAPRLRYTNDQILQNHIVYPYSFPVQQLFYPLNQPMIMATNHSQPSTINTSDHSNEHSGIMSPSSDAGISQPSYRISSWQDIVDNYEGNEEKPKCGKLKDNVYFTLRSASSDMYMLFDKKSDYINNFVNYYFSDKNLSRDQKLVTLMDDKGIVPLSALKEFPKLQQVDTTIEDLIKAFQTNSFVAAVDTADNSKGAIRRDRLNANEIITNKTNLDQKPHFSELNNESGLLNNNQQINSVSELNMTMANDNASAVAAAAQTQSYYVYNSATLVPTIYSPQGQPGAIMPPTSTLNNLPQYNPYLMAPFQYATHAPPNPPQNLYGGQVALWPVTSDYSLHHIPYSADGPNVPATAARFLSTSATAAGFSAVPGAVVAEPAGNRLIN